MSKSDQLRALREARFKKPNPFEDVARGRGAAPTSAVAWNDGSSHHGPAPGDGQNVAAVGLPKGPATATKLKRGRPKVEGKRPWETEGVSRRSWYRHLKEK